ASAGTLQIGAATLTGTITGGGQTVSNLGQLTVDNLRLDGNTLDTTSGNLTLDSTGGTTNINDNIVTTGTITVPSSNVITGTTGATQFSADVQINGGDLLTNQPTASLFNSTATTLNIGQAAT